MQCTQSSCSCFQDIMFRENWETNLKHSGSPYEGGDGGRQSCGEAAGVDQKSGEGDLAHGLEKSSDLPRFNFPLI
jgi:hypothetical protein